MLSETFARFLTQPRSKKTPATTEIDRFPFQFDVKNMARFESPLQIFGLFLCAALVAIGVIFVLNLEVDKRYGNERNVR